MSDEKIIINNSKPGSQINIISDNATINANQTVVNNRDETVIINKKDIKK